VADIKLSMYKIDTAATVLTHLINSNY